MTELIQYLLLNSLWIFGFSKLFDAGMIFSKIDVEFSLWVSPKWAWIQKPVYSCPPCMASIHGISGFFLSGLDVSHLPIYLISLIGLNTLLQSIIYR